MTTPSRLERAMALYLQCQAEGTDPAPILAANEDLRDLLEPLLCPEPDPPADAAQRYLGDFELLREVGRGGMGIVYEARQRSLGRRIALKVLTRDVATDPTRLARFRREAVALARLDHPHVVRVLDTGETDGRHWLAMEFIDGEALDRRLQRLQAGGGHHGGSRRDVVEIALAVADALQHVHATGLLHRDVKPSNILLASDGRVRLSDFGLAREERAPTLTQRGLLAGTPHYLAPEYVTAGTMTAAADVWSLGATLYEAITLVRPFDGPTNDVVLHQVVHHDPTDPRRLQPGLHPDLAAIVGMALEKEPRRRYPTMAAFAADLRAFLDLRPTVARPPTRTQRLRRWVRREPLRALLAAALLLVAALGTFVLVRLPMLRAGARAASAEEYENAIAEGFLRREAGGRELAEGAARRALELRPTAGEAMVVSTLCRLRFEGAAVALQQLDEFTAQPHDDDDACQRLRALMLGRLQRPAERDAVLHNLGAPVTQMGMLLAAGLLVEEQTPERLASARQIISTATRLGPPRLIVHVQWATVAGVDERAESADVLLRLWPEHPFAVYHAAVNWMDSDPARALELLLKAMRLGLQESLADTNLAICQFRVGDLAGSLATAMRAMADPKLPDHHREGLLQTVADGSPEAIDAAVAVWLQCFPDSVNAAREHGRQLILHGEPERAVPILEEILRHHPDDVGALTQLAHAFNATDRWVELVAVARHMRSLDPDSRDAHNFLVDALEELPDTRAERLVETRRHLARFGDDGRAWRDLAGLLLAGPTDEHPEALRAAMRAVQLTAGMDSKAIELLAKVHEALGEPAAAAAVRESHPERPTGSAGR